MTDAANIEQLRSIAAKKIAAALEGVSVGERIPLDSTSDICLVLERLVPAVLRTQHPEWVQESIDLFFLSRATKTGPLAADLVGTCILISDQTVTPFALNIEVDGSGLLQRLRIRLGERGTGPLGISGPKCTSPDAGDLLNGINDRLDRIEWRYDEVA